jgi:hypothetical protein
MAKTKWEEYKEKNNLVSLKEPVVSVNINNNFLPTISRNINFTKKQLAPGIWVYQNVFNDSLKLVEDINKHFSSEFTEAMIANGKVNEGVVKQSRDCSVIVLSKTSKREDAEKDLIYDVISESIISCMRDYVEMYNVNLDDLISDSWQILRYGKDQHFDSHADDGIRYPRTISTTAYLNDDYTGGEVYYKHFDLSYKPTRGDILIFPSNYVNNHKVIPVEEGIRYAVVNWFRWKTMKVDMLVDL